MLQKTKSLLTKCLAFLFIVCCVVAATVGLVACSNEKTVAGISVNNGKLVVKYSDGTSDDLTLVVEKPACTHAQEDKVEIKGENCTLTTIYSCVECGRSRFEVTENHNYVNRDLGRKNCLIGARNADVCTICGKETNVVYKSAEEDGESKEHTIVKVTYLLDEAHRDDPCVCESKTVVADVCSVCHETIEVISETPAPGHVFGDWTVVTEPRDVAEGIITRTCTVCSNDHIGQEDVSVYKVIPAIYVANEEGNVPAEVNGYYKYAVGTDAKSCSEKGRNDTFTFVDPAGKEHSIKRNVKTEHLLHLGDKNVEIDTSKVLVLDATYGDKVQYIGSKLPCDEKGTQGFFRCDECEKNIEVKVRSAHDAFDVKLQTEADKTLSVAPTCTAEGKNYYTCSGCTKSISVTVPATGHKVVCTDIKDPTADNEKWVFDLKCATCGTVLESVVSDKAPDHKDVEATCTDNSAVVYYNIVVGKNTDGSDKILLNDEGKPVEIPKENKGTALGHRNAVLDAVVVDNALIDLREGKNADAFDVIGIVNCANAGPEKEPKDGFYRCDICKTNRPVKVYVSHKGETKTTQYATCTGTGKLAIVKCDDCNQEDTTVDTPALGHEKIYTITEDAGVITVTWKCVRVNKEIVSDPTAEDPARTNVVETECDATGVVDKAVSSYTIITNATCKENGKARLTYADGTTEDVTLTVSGHILNGEVIVCAYNHPYAPEKEGIEYIGSVVTCKDFTAADPSNGYFVCDICKRNQPVYVKTEHKKPASFDVTDLEQHKDATCIEAGYDKFVCAGTCGEPQEIVIPALGHDLEYTEIDIEHGKFTVACKREGCALNGEGHALVVELPAHTGALTSVNGKVVVSAEVAAAAGYTVATINEGTCTNKGRYSFTLTKAAYKAALVEALSKAGHDEAEVANFDLDHEVKFEVTYGAEHDTTGSTIVWVNGGYRYIGKYCKVCGNVVIISAVKLAD